NGLREIRLADDNCNWSAAQPDSENNEARQEAAIERNTYFRRNGKGLNRSLPETRDRLRHNAYERRLTRVRRGCRAGNKQRRELLRELRKRNGGLGVLSGSDDFHSARAMPIGGKGKDRGGAMQMADGEAARPLAIDAEDARAPRRHQEVWSCRRA